MTAKSEIQEFYEGSTVLLLGGTGFIGKIVLEKLLRCCRDLKKIYVLIRPKDSKIPSVRYEELLRSPVFGQLRREFKDFKSKLDVMSGDCGLFEIGLSEQDKEIVKNEVNVIINSASCTDLNSSFRTMIKTNISSVKTLLEFAKEMKQLKCFVHLSTAFSQSPRDGTIDEIIYEAPMKLGKILYYMNQNTEEILDYISKCITRGWPNGYVFTKAVSESLIKDEGENLPVCIVRPSLVISAHKEPLESWIENTFPTRSLMHIYRGDWHAFRVNDKASVDMVPVDLAASAVLAASWATANKSKILAEELEKHANFMDEKIFEIDDLPLDVPVFNVVSSTQKVYRWRDFISQFSTMSTSAPLENSTWYNFFYYTRCAYFHYVLLAIYQFLPAILLDLKQLVLMRKPKYYSATKETMREVGTLEDFAQKEYIFINNNVSNVWSKMTAEDKKLFGFDFSSVDWNEYVKNYVLGCREFIEKENRKDIPEAVVAHRKKRMFHYFLVGFFVYLLVKSFMCIYNYILN